MTTPPTSPPSSTSGAPTPDVRATPASTSSTSAGWWGPPGRSPRSPSPSCASPNPRSASAAIGTSAGRSPAGRAGVRSGGEEAGTRGCCEGGERRGGLLLGVMAVIATIMVVGVVETVDRGTGCAASASADRRVRGTGHQRIPRESGSDDDPERGIRDRCGDRAGDRGWRGDRGGSSEAARGQADAAQRQPRRRRRTCATSAIRRARRCWGGTVLAVRLGRNLCAARLAEEHPQEYHSPDHEAAVRVRAPSSRDAEVCVWPRRYGTMFNPLMRRSPSVMRSSCLKRSQLSAGPTWLPICERCRATNLSAFLAAAKMVNARLDRQRVAEGGLVRGRPCHDATLSEAIDRGVT